MPTVGGATATILGRGTRLYPGGRGGSLLLLSRPAHGYLRQLQISCQPA